jgi:hypothetical protein
MGLGVSRKVTLPLIFFSRHFNASVAYRNRSEVLAATFLPPGYAKIAGRIGDRRMILTGYRLANVLIQTLSK